MGNVPEPGRAVQLTSDEVALVLRRAAEIEAETGDDLTDPTRYDPAAIEAAAGEVGLSPTAVRQAVAELRVGSLGGPAGGAVARRGRRRRPSDLVAEQRSVGRSPEAVLGSLDRLLRGHLFQPGRRTADRAVFRPRDDLVARLRRRLDFVGTIRLDGVSWVSAVATPADGGTLLRVEAELARSRSSVVAGSAAAGGGVATLMGLGGALFHEPALVISALPAGTLIGAGGMRARGQRWEQKRAEIAETLAALLDRL
jgi:hypothetical protein